jgi:RimJ/RimL family protein N-acetyltransferase
MSRLEAELLRSDDPSWDRRLEGIEDDVYHRAGYHRFVEGSVGGTGFLAVIRDPRGGRGLLWPYLLRPVAEAPHLSDAAGFDVDSVYGYPGPLVWGCRPEDEFVPQAMDALLAVWRDQGAVTAFTRFHPLLGNELWGAELPVAGPDGGEPILPVGETVAIDLRQGDAEAVAAYSKTLRQEIASARRRGMGTRLDEDWSSLETFAELYRATMARNRAEDAYYFSMEDFRSLKLALGSELHLLVTEVEGRTAAAGLFTEHRGIVQAHLVGTDEEFRAWSPLKLLLDDVRRWATERGNHLLHLGGGRGGRDDSLLAFKRRFSPLRFRFALGRWVLDPAVYATLVSTWKMRAEATGPVVWDRTFFPAYRSPVHLDDVEFHVVSSEDQRSLAEVFADLDDTFFRPHPFTAEEARRLANHSGRDVFGLLEQGDSPVAYGMLRGWDDGYSTPSLGIAVRTSAQGRGYAKRMLAHLHEEARRRGADRIRLRVHPDNVVARRLYESFGYQYQGEDRGELVMIVDLSEHSEQPAASILGSERKG